jgi:hypothetical protein
MMNRGLSVVVLLVLALAAPLAQEQKPSADLSGKWTMRLKTHESEQSLALTLKQTGEKVTGVWATPHASEVDLAGTYAAGKLTLATPEGAEMQVTFTGALKADGSLAGTISSAMGDAPWSATRTK